MLLTVADYSEEKDIKSLFKEISGDDLEVDAYELRDILDSKFKPGFVEITFIASLVAAKLHIQKINQLIIFAEFKFKGFNLETARSMVAMMDVSFVTDITWLNLKGLNQKISSKTFIKEVNRGNIL